MFKKYRIKKVDYCPKFPYKVQIRKGLFKWITKSHCHDLEGAKYRLLNLINRDEKRN